MGRRRASVIELGRMQCMESKESFANLKRAVEVMEAGRSAMRHKEYGELKDPVSVFCCEEWRWKRGQCLGTRGW